MRRVDRRCWEPLEPRLLLAAELFATSLPPNVESNLATAYARRLSRPVQGKPVNVEPAPDDGLLRFDEAGSVLVCVWVTGEDHLPAVTQDLGGLGAHVLASSAAYRLVEAWLDLATLPQLATTPGVLAVTPVYHTVTRAGAVQSQGDAIVNADDVRALGNDGSAVRVGVLSDSALNLGSSQATGDLSATVDTYLEFPATDEGRAMLEIVHDLAPGARLAHHSGLLSELSFADGIRRLAAAGSRVIVDDLWYFAEPFFQDGIIAQAVNDVAAAGVTYVSAAGNDADRSYDATFVDAGGASAGLHDFDPSAAVDTRQRITVPAGTGAALVLQWDDPFYTTSGVTRDFNVKVYDAVGAVVASASTNNLATQQPLEVVAWNGAGTGVYHVEIQRAAGGGAARLKYVLSTSVAGSIDEFATHSGTVVGHPAAAGAIAVGAVPFHDPTNAEPFSARGDATILFDPAGTRLALAQTRQKPDVVAPDAVNTTFFGADIPQDADTRPNFSGTSAAAPHVAAVAALLLDANPHLTRQQVYDAITTTAVDLGAAGRDTTFGIGRVDALAARNAAVAMPDTTAPVAALRSPAAGATHGWRIGRIEGAFSEPLVATAANTAANYGLLGAGGDNAFGNGDDVAYTVSPAYDVDERSVVLTVTAPASTLPSGRYRLTLDGTGAGALRDPSGNGLAGGDPAFEFTIAAKGQIVLLDDNANQGANFTAAQADLRPDGTLVAVYPNNPSLNHAGWPQVMVGQHDSAGQRDGPSRSIPTDIVNSFRVENPDVAVSATGGVIAYSDYEEIIVGEPDGFDMAFQLIDATGRPVGTRQIAGFAEDARNPRVDMEAAGRFAITWWTKAYVPALDRYEVRTMARHFLADGQPVGPVFRVNQQSHTASGSVVTTLPGGGSVYAWVYSSTGETGSSVWARRYDATGTPLGDEFRVSPVGGGHSSAEIAAGPGGTFAVAWEAINLDPSEEFFDGVYVRRYDAAGSPVGVPIRVSPGGATPQVAFAADGRFVVAWQGEDSNADGWRDGIYARRYAADGSPVGTPYWVSQGQAASTQPQLPKLAVTDGGDFVVTWTTISAASGTTAHARWLSWDGAGDLADIPHGPWVRSQAPSSRGSSAGPLGSATVTFDRPINVATFTTADVQMFDPAGRAIVASSVSTSDGQTFTIAFPAQQLPGRYRMNVGPDIADTAGRLMNEDGDGTGGEALLDDYHGTFAIATTQVAAFPLTQGFEVGGVDALPGSWSLLTAGTGSINIDNTGTTPHGGGTHLHFKQSAIRSTNLQQASVVMDLSGQAGATNLELDFWAWCTEPQSQNNDLHVFLSGDGVNWSLLGERLFPTRNAYTHYSFDLDEALAAAQIAVDSSVHLRFQHFGTTSLSDMTLDDIRVSNVDAAGPRLLSSTPSGHVPGPVTSLSVTFSEDINAATFNTADVSLIGPAGNVVALAGDPIDTGDHRTFTLNLSGPQALAGTYTLRIGPNVFDANGNPMNQDADNVDGEPTEDRFAATFTIGPPVAQTPNYAQGFESGDIGSLAGWSFAVGGVATVAVSAEGTTPYAGAYHLYLGQPTTNASNLHEATLLLDLSGHTGATNLALDFRAWATDPQFQGNWFDLHVSGDGVNWSPLALTVAPPVNIWTHYAYDLDQALSAAGIAFDSSVHLRFRHARSNAFTRMALDEVRVSTGDVTGPRIVSQTPSGQVAGPLTAVSVTFNEEINPTTFTAADVNVIGPVGQAIALAGDPVDTGDHRTFTLNLAAPQSLAGTYAITIGPDVRDPAGNLMNQDADAANGEVAEDRYAGTVRLTAAPQTLPYAQGFESGGFGGLPGWSFGVAGTATVDIVNSPTPRSGAFHLKFDQGATNGSNLQDAILLLDLSAEAGATNLALDFWLNKLATQSQSNHVFLHVSGDGVAWSQVDQIFPTLNQYTHHVYDLDQALSGAGIVLDASVYVRWQHFGLTSLEEVALDDVRVRAGPTNRAPTLTTVATLTGAAEGQDYTITHAALLAAANEADPNNDPLGFRIDSLTSGTLTKDGQPVTPGVTTLGPGEQLVWRPAPYASGSLNAFTIRAFDGDLTSASAVQVKVDVAPVPYRAEAYPFQPIDLVAGASGVVSLLDFFNDNFAAVPLGGNAFTFFQTTYTANAIWVSSNGLITFGSGNAIVGNGDLTSAPTQAAIAPLWDDWTTAAGAADQVLYRFDDLNADGTPDRLVIEWNDVPRIGQPATNPVTFQAILQLNSAGEPGVILFNYPDLEVGSAAFDNGASATVGIKDAGSQGPYRLLVSQDSGGNPLIGSSKAVRVTKLADVTAPRVTSAFFDDASAAHAIRVTFSEDLGRSLGRDDLALLNLTTGQPIAAAAMSLSYDLPTRTATWTFSPAQLPNGRYRASLAGLGITDAALNMLDGNADATPGDDHVFSFIRLQGDTNRDGRVDVLDLGTLATFYLQSVAPFGPARGDFNYDGLVDVLDIGILSSVYGSDLTTPALGTTISAQAGRERSRARIAN